MRRVPWTPRSGFVAACLFLIDAAPIVAGAPRAVAAPTLSTALGSPHLAVLSQVDESHPVVAAPTLPRLRRVWAVAGLKTTHWRYQEGAPVSQGVLMAWTADAPDQLVAIDTATGKERWRVAEQADMPPQIEFARNMVLLNYFGGATTARDLKTGRSLWTADLCMFIDHVRDNGSVGFVRCEGPAKVFKAPSGRIRGSVGTAFLIAFDLASGRELWRREAGAGRGAWNGVASGSPAIGAREIHVQWDGALRTLDPRTGKELRQLPLPTPTWSWSVFDVETGGRDLALLTGSGGGGTGPNQMKAIRLSDGGELWTRPYPQRETSEGYGADVRDGRLLEARLSEITEIDLSNGQDALTCLLPRVHEYHNPRRWRLMRGRVAAMMEAGFDQPSVVVRCGAYGGKPTLASIPMPAPPAVWSFVAMADDTVVVRIAKEMVGFAVHETEPPAYTLPPPDRVRAILDRAGGNPGYAADSIEHNRRIFEELGAVPGFARDLLALAKEAHPSRRDRAVDAATALRIPGVVDLLLDEIFRSPPVPPIIDDDHRRAHDEQMRPAAALVDQLGENHLGPDRNVRRVHTDQEAAADVETQVYRLSLWRRADQIVMLSSFGDPKAASRLGPLLLARSTPEGLGWWNWNVWGRWSEDRYGQPAWDGESRFERRSHMQDESTGAGHSESLPASSGHPEAHAAIYRLLARLGRREDLARLEELDRTTARSGGWASICAADDAVKKPEPPRVWPPRVWVEPWGLCRGIDVADMRVTQARNVVWLRRRLANGSFGPPAWANDLGGDQCLETRVMQKAEMNGGRIRLRVNLDRASVGHIDPAAVFADGDGDGLTDGTEAAFGTDPKRADTDGDGVPDGRDPAPLTKPLRDVRADALGEIFRYATLFLVGGPITFQGDRAVWGESANAAGLLLHLPPETDADDQVCSGARVNEPNRQDGSRSVRQAFPLARVQSLKISRDRAQGRFIWSTRGTRVAHDFDLHRVGGERWRVMDDRPVANFR